jgi:hypothetical protein
MSGPPARPTPVDPVAKSSPLAETLRALNGCQRQADIVRYLWNRTEPEAPLSVIAKDLWNARDATLNRSMPTVRKAVERTRDNLEARGCPLGIVISANSVQLVNR